MDRNLIIALAATALLIIGYDALIVGPKRDAYRQAQAEQAAMQAERMDPADAGQALFPGSDEALTREAALLEAPGRLPIETPELTGSLNLRGLMFDDLTLKNFRATVDDESPMITLLSPQNAPHAQFMRAGLRIGSENDARLVWEAPEGAVLTPSTPVTLTHTANGVEQEVVVSVDEQFMFTVAHTVKNLSTGDIVVQPIAGSFQRGIPEDLQNFMILFEGPLAVAGDKLFERKYKKIQNKGGLDEVGDGGWVGITDKYWLAAAIPPQDANIRASIGASGDVTDIFYARYILDPETISPNQGYTYTSRLYAGAKEVSVLRSYQDAFDIHRFDWAVDWGNFSFLTRPIFNTLNFFHGLVGNWGVAILLLTLVIKAILFPLANLSYKSMAGMRKVGPEMTKIRERYKDDQVKQQQEMMALYKKHKINPAAGCLPAIAQMPIFYALYKTLFVTIELRHEGFLYISDLSESDPTTIFNLFGLLPYDPTNIPMIGAFLGIGILPLLMGAAMFVQTKLNPPPPDPMQRQIFALMPLFFMFIFAPFAAGLVLYWFWNTFLSVIQQYVIMKRQGADVDILGNIKSGFGGDDKPANENKSS